jgi:hypothetical protein
MKNYCINCKKIISKIAKRCKKCHLKSIIKRGKDSPQYIDGRSHKESFCIDYNKFNNHKNNLITLCHHCNVRVNTNRDYWFAYFAYLREAKT